MTLPPDQQELVAKIWLLAADHEAGPIQSQRDLQAVFISMPGYTQLMLDAIEFVNKAYAAKLLDPMVTPPQYVHDVINDLFEVVKTLIKSY